MAIAACAKTVDPEIPANPFAGFPESAAADSALVSKTFTASFAGMTNAVFPELKPVIEAGGKVAVYDGLARREFSIESVDGDEAVISGSVSADATVFCAVYPWSASSSVIPSSAALCYTIPSAQTASAAGTAETVAGIAWESGGAFEFSSSVSYVAVEITDEDIKSISLSGLGGEGVSGAVYCAPGDSFASAGTSSVTLAPSGEYFSPGTYYIAVAPAHFSSGFNITFNTDDYKCWIQSSDAQDAAAGGGFTADISSFTRLPLTIYDAETLKAFAARMDLYESTDVVRLTSDIDLGLEPWDPFTLTCVLDGSGHKIYNLKVSLASGRAGFLSGLTGTLRNIVFGSQDGETYDGSSVIEYTGTAATYMGLVADVQGTVLGVKSFVSIVHSSNDSGNSIGGIAGCVEGGGAIYDSEFAGTVTLNDNTAASPHFVGGIVGRLHSNVPAGAIALSGDIFSGSINCGDSKVQGIGGVVGIHQGGSVTRCTSAGQVSVTNGYGDYCNYGGIAGYVQYVTGASITNCTNSAVLDAPYMLRNAGGIVGLFRSGEVEISGNVNLADISITTPTSSSGQIGSVGGIVGYVWEGSPSITGNTNAGAIHSEAKNVNKSAGGIVGATITGLDLSSNINTGSVSIYSTGAYAAFAGGILGGMIHGSDTASSKSSVTFSGDRSTGAITSALSSGNSSNAGAIFGAVVSNGYYNVTVSGCGVGGTVNGNAVTSGNYAGRNYLYGYINASTAAVTVTNCAFAAN